MPPAYGYRIRHPDPRYRGALLKIPHPERRTANGPKTYELRLDGEGTIIVSAKVWAGICGCWIRTVDGLLVAADTVFEVVNTVQNAPTQRLGFAKDQVLNVYDLSSDSQAAPATRSSLEFKDR